MINFIERKGKTCGRYTKEESEHNKKCKLQLLQYMKELNKTINFKVSARGWCYLLENQNYINKGQFDKIQKIINEFRNDGSLPIDFTAKDSSRQFDFIDPFIIRTLSPELFLLKTLRKFNSISYWKNDIAFWEDKKFYLMMIVEKIDVKTLFSPICKKYHIPISNAKGWSSKNQRYFILKKCKLAERLGLDPIILYYGDHDIGGLRISDTLRKNIYDIEKTTKLHTKNIFIERIGLNYDFIEKYNLTWIDNLISGSGNLPNYKNEYTRNYIDLYGERKCEANAILPNPQPAIDGLEKVILSYLGDDCLEIYNEKVSNEQQKVDSILQEIGYYSKIEELINDIKK